MSKQREDFEAWYFNENYKNTTACKLKVFEILSGLVGVEAPYNNTYLNYNVQISWQAWQQAQKVAVPEWLSEHIDVNFDDQREDDQHSYWSGYNQALREIKAMIKAVDQPV